MPGVAGGSRGGVVSAGRGIACGRGVRRILAIRRKALGDALVTLPAVLRLAAAFPEAALDLVVDRPFAPLLAGLAPELRVVPWPPAGGRRPGVWTAQLRAARYDLVVDWLGSPRTALWTALSGAPLRVGYDLRLRGWAYNVRVPRDRTGATPLAQFAGEAFLDPLRALGFEVAPWLPAAARPPAGGGAEYRAWAAAWRAGAGPRVGLVLSATWSAKAWPVERAAELCRLAGGAGARVLLIPGPGDAAVAAALGAAAPAVPHAPPTTLLELADLLATLDVLVGTDSGARHLATVLGVPTVTVYGPTDPRGWNPVHPERVAVRTGEACSPCDLTECPVPGHPCMTRLTGAMVWAKVQALLAGRSARPAAAGTAADRERP